MDLLGTLLNGMTSQSSLDSLSKKAKANTDQVSDLLSSALPLMMGKVSGNASTKEGAASLIGALSQHTSTASLEEQIKDADDEVRTERRSSDISSARISIPCYRICPDSAD